MGANRKMQRATSIARCLEQPGTQKLPFWSDGHIQPGFDIVLLRPATSPSSERFETRPDATEKTKRLRERLAPVAAPEIRNFIDEVQLCSKRDPCERPNCPACGRLFRRWITARLLELQEGRKKKCIVTIALGVVKGGKLGKVDLHLISQRLRKKLSRSGLTGCIAVGGIEVAYKSKKGIWRLHAHLLVLGSTREVLDNLRGEEGDLQIDGLTDLPKQLSYLMKFSTGHRPGARTGQKQRRMYPLPLPALIELVSWSNRYHVSDFMFAFGVRRRGQRFEGA